MDTKRCSCCRRYALLLWVVLAPTLGAEARVEAKPPATTATRAAKDALNEELLAGQAYQHCCQRLRSGSPPQEVAEDIRKVLAEYKNTSYADDFLLLWAQARIADGHPKEAVVILQPLLNDNQATVVDMNFQDRGHIPPQELVLFERLREFRQNHPELSNERSILLQANADRAAGDVNAAWDALEILHQKYPTGDAAEAMKELLAKAKKERLFTNPFGVDDRGVMPGEYFVAYRRPHLLGLLEQLSMCGQRRDTAPAVCISVCADLVRTYGSLLTRDELKRVGTVGSEQLARMDVTQLEGGEKSLSAIKDLFAQAIREAQESEARDKRLPPVQFENR